MHFLHIFRKKILSNNLTKAIKRFFYCIFMIFGRFATKNETKKSGKQKNITMPFVFLSSTILFEYIEYQK
jgi:hypothetical protein